MENWKTHVLSFIVVSGFLILALASDDNDYSDPINPCWDPALNLKEPLAASISHAITYEVKVIDKETNQPISDITVDVSAISYNCQEVSSCPEKCWLETIYSEGGHFIGLTNGNGLISHTIPNFTATDKKDRMKLVITVKDENLLQYAYRRKDVMVGQDATSISVTIALIKDLI